MNAEAAAKALPAPVIAFVATTFTHEKETVGTWDNSVGRSISVDTRITTGLPRMGGGADLSVDVTASQQRSWGGSKGETQTVEDTTTIVVPEQTSMTVRIVVGRSRVTIPFTYTVERVDLTGHAMPPVTDENGVYQQVETLGTDVQVTSSPITVASPFDPPGRPMRSSGT